MGSSRAVITICSIAHKEVWSRTSRLLPLHVTADSYHVFVPAEELGEFEKITGPDIEIHTQESISEDYLEALKHQVALEDNSARLGWYLQQFHKIQALRIVEAEELIIWDADCVPLKEIRLFSDVGTPIYMRASENHRPYFEMIGRLLGLERVQDSSFVIPGFPILKSWVNDFLNGVEARHHPLRWFEAVMESTDFSLQSGFSETETLGTWIANSYSGSWEHSEVAWERKGQSRFGFAADFSLQDLISLGAREKLDIVTFENWDFPRQNGRLVRYLHLIKKIAGRG